MEIAEYIRYFINSETPFMLLFVSLFFYNIKTNRDREKRWTDLTELKLAAMQEEMHVLIRVWKILLEKELEKRNQHNMDKDKLEHKKTNL
jgi:hypothetical protein